MWITGIQRAYQLGPFAMDRYRDDRRAKRKRSCHRFITFLAAQPSSPSPFPPYIQPTTRSGPWPAARRHFSQIKTDPQAELPPKGSSEPYANTMYYLSPFCPPRYEGSQSRPPLCLPKGSKALLAPKRVELYFSHHVP